MVVVGKQDKGTKYFCRTRKVSPQKLEKLYKGVNDQCRNCMYDCKNEVNVDIECVNKKTRPDINEISEMLKEENVNLNRLCNDYNLKLYILMDMLRGNKDLSYKYYTCLMDRLHLVKDSDEINKEYQQGVIGSNLKDGADI